jgi:serine protease inhibitor
MTKRTVHTPGRKPMKIPDNLMQIYAEMNTTDMARHYQVSRATISKWLKIKKQETTTGGISNG